MKKLLCIFTVVLIVFSAITVSAAETSEIKAELTTAEQLGLVTDSVMADYEKDITREQFTELICLLYDKLSETSDTEPKAEAALQGADALREAKFTDTANESVKRAYALGFVNGISDQLFEPFRELTRQEAVTILTRVLFSLNPDYDPYLHAEYSFIDDWQIDYWAENAVEFAYYCGIIKGTEDYVISPRKFLTCGEATLMVKRAAENADGYFEGGKGYNGFEWYIKPKYDGLVTNTRFLSGLAVVKKGNKYGYINTLGEEVIPFRFDNAYGFSNGMAKVKINGKYGYIDRTGNLTVDAIYDDGGDFFEEVVWVRKDGKFGYVDKLGNVVIPFIYDHAYPFTEGVASVKKDGFYGFIDHSGNTVIDFKFKWAAAFSEERARVGEMGRYGYIDHSGELVIPMIYEKVLDFNDDRAAVYYRDFGGVIDKDGGVIVPFFKYSEVGGYYNGVCHVRNHGVENPDYSGSSYYVDKNGNILNSSAGNYEICEGLSSMMAPSTVHGKVLPSLRDKKAQLIIPTSEDYYSQTKEEQNIYLFMQFSEGMAGVVDRSGKLGFIKNPLLK
ncbi:MAG: WG repeat-containing protein [Clostridia bacterium]|nr:WG repeat-containing protein [Clostridia bacterium]